MNCQCYYNNKNISSSSIACAAYLEGNIISLQKAPEFFHEHLIVQFSNIQKTFNNVTIPNLTKIEQARKLCPRYKLSPKHQQGGWGTLMDLLEEKAQIALNQSVQSGRQRYSYYNNKFYEFQFDNTFDSEGYPTYHGYPISESEVPHEIKIKLKND